MSACGSDGQPSVRASDQGVADCGSDGLRLSVAVTCSLEEVWHSGGGGCRHQRGWGDGLSLRWGPCRCLAVVQVLVPAVARLCSGCVVCREAGSGEALVPAVARLCRVPGAGSGEVCGAVMKTWLAVMSAVVLCWWRGLCRLIEAVVDCCGGCVEEEKLKASKLCCSGVDAVEGTRCVVAENLSHCVVGLGVGLAVAVAVAGVAVVRAVTGRAGAAGGAAWSGSMECTRWRAAGGGGACAVRLRAVPCCARPQSSSLARHSATVVV